MKLTTPQIKSLAAGLPVKKCRESSGAFWELNHEVWRKCNQCGEVFDLRKTLDCKCPVCSCTNLSI